MFKVQKQINKPVSWPVSVDTPVDGGGIEKIEFTGLFRLLSDDERQQLVSTPVDDANPIDTTLDKNKADTQIIVGQWKESMIDKIMDVMTGWKDVADQDGNELPFSRDNLRAAARCPYGIALLRGINVAIGEVSSGARQKN